MAPAIDALYETYKKNEKMAFFLIYVNEAHPSRRPVKNDKEATYRGIGRAEKLEDRILAASKCVLGLRLKLPILIDTMSSVAQKAYRGRPAATAVIDMEGKIRLHTTGPFGSRPDKVKPLLEKLLKEPIPPNSPKQKKITEPKKKKRRVKI